MYSRNYLLMRLNHVLHEGKTSIESAMGFLFFFRDWLKDHIAEHPPVPKDNGFGFEGHIDSMEHLHLLVSHAYDDMLSREDEAAQLARFRCFPMDTEGVRRGWHIGDHRFAEYRNSHVLRIIGHALREHGGVPINLSHLLMNEPVMVEQATARFCRDVYHKGLRASTIEFALMADHEKLRPGLPDYVVQEIRFPDVGCDAEIGLIRDKETKEVKPWTIRLRLKRPDGVQIAYLTAFVSDTTDLALSSGTLYLRCSLEEYRTILDTFAKAWHAAASQ